MCNMRACSVALSLALWCLVACTEDIPDDANFADIAADVAADQGSTKDDASEADVAQDAGVDVAVDAGPACKDGADCDDGDPCTEKQTCNGGTCGQGKPVACDDDEVCTSDSCNSDKDGCVYLPVQVTCSDGDHCTVEDGCDEGKCAGNKVTCLCAVDADCAPMDDGDACNGTLHCVLTSSGFKCQVDPATEPPPCPADGDTDCVHNICQPKTGKCAMIDEAAGKACEDGDLCTQGEKCTAGKCVDALPKACKDGNPCTKDDCKPDKGCLFPPAAGACDDDNACTSGDKCGEGKCQPGPPASCDDGDACTDDNCSPAKGCQHLPNAATCTDNDACTVDDVCKSGTCTPGAAKVCDDGNACTVDSCKKNVGCAHDKSSDGKTTCDDGDLCTDKDHCDAGKCVAGAVKKCDDGNPCTKDSCAMPGGCAAAPVDKGPCDDGQECTVKESCEGGKCGGGKPALFEVLVGEPATTNHVAVVRPAHNGDIFVLGWSIGQTGPGAAIALWRLSRAGKLLWHKTYKPGMADVDDKGKALLPMKDGGAILLGEASSVVSGQTSKKIWLTRVGAQGKVLWSHTLPGSHHSFDAPLMVRMPDDSVAFASRYVYKGAFSCRVSRYHASGKKVFDLVHNLYKNCTPRAVTVNKDGSWTVAASVIVDAPPGFDVALLVVSDAGVIVSKTVIATPDSRAPWTVQRLADGGHLIAGQAYQSSTQQWPLRVLRVDKAGKTVTDVPIDLGMPASYGGIERLSDGEFVFAGRRFVSPGKGYAMSARFSADGDVRWLKSAGSEFEISDGYPLLDGAIALASRQTKAGAYTGKIRLELVDGWGHPICKDKGGCFGKKVADCDDGKDCTGVGCVVGQGCINSALSKVDCDDGKPCTSGETCQAGTCQGGVNPLFDKVYTIGVYKSFGKAIANHPDGGLVATGMHYVGNLATAYVARLDEQGKMLWKQGAPGSKAVFASDISALKNGQVVVTGQISKSMDLPVLFRTSASGNQPQLVEYKTLSGSHHGVLRDLIERADGTQVAVGYDYVKVGAKDITLYGRIRVLSANGAVQSSKTVVGLGLFVAAARADGGIYAGGTYVNPSFKGSRGWLQGYDAKMNPAWAKPKTLAAGNGSVVLYGLTILPDGSCATSASYAHSGKDTQMAMWRLSSAGSELALAVLPGQTATHNRSISALPGGELVLSGFRVGGGGVTKAALLVSVDAKGKLLWERALGDKQVNNHGDHVSLSDGTLALIGTRDKVGGLSAWVIRTDRWGHAACDPKGKCAQPNPPGCDDGNPCSYDLCDESKGCQHLPISDGLPCGAGGTCKSGTCN